jgi:type IV pilus assembly protein PilM
MIGIDISDRSIKLAEVAGRHTSELRTVCWYPLVQNLMRRGVVQDVEAVTESLREALTKCSPLPIRGSDVAVSIPEVQSFVRVLDLPPMKEQEVNEAVLWAVRRHIPFDLDRVYLGWEPLRVSGKGTQKRQVLVGAAQKDVVDPLLQVLDSLDFNVAALELETQAVLRCLLPRSYREAYDIRGVLVIDLGATLTNVMFYDRGAMRFTTSIQWGGDDLTQSLAHDLDLSATKAAKEKMTVGASGKGDNEAVSSVVESSVMGLVHKIERVVHEMSVQLSSEQRVRMVLLSGGGAGLDGIVDLFSSVFTGIPVQLGNPWTNLNVEGKEKNVELTKKDALHFTTALGLALREVDYV